MVFHCSKGMRNGFRPSTVDVLFRLVWLEKDGFHGCSWVSVNIYQGNPSTLSGRHLWHLIALQRKSGLDPRAEAGAHTADSDIRRHWSGAWLFFGRFN